jgi:predicted GNAT family N-acyltransferase
MLYLKDIEYGTDEYLATLELRNKVMRVPLGLDIHNEDFSFEKNAVIVGAFEEEKVVGVGVMTIEEDVFKLEYLCVDSDIQSNGAGGLMLRYLEQKARDRKGTKICLDARVSAEGFYQQHGYKTIGDVFLLDYAPVEHVVMEKNLLGAE